MPWFKLMFNCISCSSQRNRVFRNLLAASLAPEGATKKSTKKTFHWKKHAFWERRYFNLWPRNKRCAPLKRCSKEPETYVHLGEAEAVSLQSRMSFLPKSPERARNSMWLMVVATVVASLQANFLATAKWFSRKFLAGNCSCHQQGAAARVLRWEKKMAPQ